MASTDSRFFRRFVNWVLLPLGGVLISLSILEGLLRIANVSFPVFDAYDALRGTALRPGKEGWYQREGRAYLRINSLGYRDSEHEIAKPAGTFRIAVLGDSFAEARQVAQEDTFWSLLSRDLGSCPGLNGKKVEVLNFGIARYGTTHELLTLRKDALRFSPDLILLAFFPGNDFQDNSKELSSRESWRLPGPYYVHSGGDLILETTFQQSLAQRLLYKSVQHSRLLELLNEARRVWVVRREKALASRGETGDLNPNPSDAIYAPPSDAAWREAWLITEELLNRMNRDAMSSGARLVVTIISTPPQVYPDTATRRAIERSLGVEDLFYANRRLVGIGQKFGFPVISLAEALQRIATDKGIYLHGFKNTAMGIGHWNEEGHRYAAGILSKEICTSLGRVNEASAPAR
jgi:hypothetical protein